MSFGTTGNLGAVPKRLVLSATCDLTKRANDWHPETTPIVIDDGDDVVAAGNARIGSLTARQLADAIPGQHAALRETLLCCEALFAAVARRIADGSIQREEGADFHHEDTKGAKK